LVLFFKKEHTFFLMLLERPKAPPLAYEHIPGRAPTLVFLPGFRSDMTGDKARMLAEFAASHGNACLRLDYSGHGASGGNFEDGTIGIWARDALFVIDHITQGPIVLVGSSMGGWIALLVALARPERVAALVGIAAAPDFTENSIWKNFSQASRERLLREKVLRSPSAYGGEHIITLALIEDGRTHLLLDAPIAITCPVRLLQGQLDADVPWQTALRIAEKLQSTDVRVTLVKDGEHRLSRPQDLAVLRDIVRPLLLQDGA
jgi:pimeloyl-ACP methyl ester carboxylesterase